MPLKAQFDGLGSLLCHKCSVYGASPAVANDANDAPSGSRSNQVPDEPAGGSGLPAVAALPPLAAQLTPESLDTIYSAKEGATITAPALFSNCSGRV